MYKAADGIGGPLKCRRGQPIMGWKAFNLFATAREDGYLTTFPLPLPDKARAFLKLLGGKYESRGDATLENGLNPSNDDDLYVGAYADALVLGSVPISAQAFTQKVPRAVECAAQMLPGCRVLVVTLHSVVDLFGYAWFEGGKLVRGRAGSADDGIFFETGEFLPLERNLKDFDESIDGEDLVMELCRPFLGCRIDEFDAWNLRMELFRKRPQ